MREAVAAKIEEIAQQVTQSEGLELVEVEVKGGADSGRDAAAGGGDSAHAPAARGGR